jgi:hypothetical protein
MRAKLFGWDASFYPRAFCGEDSTIVVRRLRRVSGATAACGQQGGCGAELHDSDSETTFDAASACGWYVCTMCYWGTAAMARHGDCCGHVFPFATALWAQLTSCVRWQMVSNFIFVGELIQHLWRIFSCGGYPCPSRPRTKCCSSMDGHIPSEPNTPLASQKMLRLAACVGLWPRTTVLLGLADEWWSVLGQSLAGVTRSRWWRHFRCHSLP